MARKKKRIDYGTSKKKIAEVETKEQMRAEFPKELVDAFVAVRESNWENDKLYNKYKKIEAAHLGKAVDDPIKQGALIVKLSLATSDMVQKNMICKKHPKYKAIRKPRVDCKECWRIYNAKGKAKEEKTEEAAQSNGDSGLVSEVGSDAQQEERKAEEADQKEDRDINE